MRIKFHHRYGTCECPFFFHNKDGVIQIFGIRFYYGKWEKALYSKPEVL